MRKKRGGTQVKPKKRIALVRAGTFLLTTLLGVVSKELIHKVCILVCRLVASFLSQAQ
jgi:hypothetical protein